MRRFIPINISPSLSLHLRTFRSMELILTDLTEKMPEKSIHLSRASDSFQRPFYPLYALSEMFSMSSGR